MLRLLFLLFTFAGLAAPALACEMATSKRESVVANYVENGKECLTAPPGKFRFDPEMERSFVQKINAERNKRGLSTLIVREDMRPAARFHSLDMGANGFFGHKSPKGKGHAFRMSAFDRTLLTHGSAENVAQFGPATCVDSLGNTMDCTLAPGFELPTRKLVIDDLHAKLMQSEGHRRNILDPEMTHISLGVARTDTGFYVTQMFALKIGELGQSLPLRLKAGDQIASTATVPGWSVTNFALARDASPDNLVANTIPETTRGDVELRVRAENNLTKTSSGSTTTITEWIYPTGPALTVVAPTGS